MAINYGYGYFIGGDPRKFSPDIELCTKEEIAAWEEACKQWNEGNEIECVGSHRWITNADGKVIGTATVSSFGIGVYEYEDEQFDDEA